MRELLDLLVQVRSHPGDLGLGQRVDAQLLDKFVHAASRDPGEVTVGHDGDHRRFGAFASFEQPIREIGALPQIGDREVHSPDQCVQITVPVTVALGYAVRGLFALFRAGHGVCVGAEQRVDHGLQHLPHHIRGRIGERFDKQALRIDNMRGGHRSMSFRVK